MYMRRYASIRVDSICLWLVYSLTIFIQPEKSLSFEEDAIILQVVNDLNYSYKLTQYDVEFSGKN